jgi:hypothetical protein
MTGSSILARKLGKLLSGRYSAMQMLQRINRSPLKHVVKALSNATDVPGKLERRAFAKRLAERPEVSTLRHAGYSAIAPDGALLDELKAAASRLREEVGEEHRRRNKGYLKAFIAQDLDAGAIDNTSVYVRYALQPAVVDVVAKYFGEAPYLSYVALDLSEYAGEELATSQLWHQDHDDTKVVKLFTYLTDVPDLEHGPFTFVEPEASKAIRGSVSTHLKDEAVTSRVPATAFTRMTGDTGSTFLVDTGRCYHMGSRIAPGRQRLMYTACYITWPPIYPDFRNHIAIAGELSEREKLLLLPTRTRES